ncbi:three-Cys-motif partner protein TcmP [candidate division KSB1 bacterium]|nr:three-Cys-motif partner protein TcmP [candidate division KSB1 bacterium]
MTNYSASFFDGKREWSEVKDQVLAHYIEAYLKKVKMLNKPILLIDAFAGQGKFGDGKPGSPLLMLEKAEKYVPNNYFAIFVNKEKEDHRQLEKNIAP